MAEKRQLVLVDAKNMVFRHHWAHADLADDAGNPTSVLYGFMNGLLSLAHKLPGARFTFVWDGGGRTWRHDLLSESIQALGKTGQKSEQSASTASVPASTWVEKQMRSSLAFLSTGGGQKKSTNARTSDRKDGSSSLPRSTESSSGENSSDQKKPQGYKANRAEMWASAGHQTALEQIPELTSVLRRLGFRQWRVAGLEGDDLLAILAKFMLKMKWYDRVAIHSTDQDFYQLLPEVRILKNIRDGKLWWVSEDDVLIENGIPALDWTKLRALIGDSSDNIPRLFRGVGPKTAVKWLRDGLDPSLENFDDHKKIVRDAYAIVTMGQMNHEIRLRWPEIRRNYSLSELVTSPDDPRLSERTRTLLNHEIEQLSETIMDRNPKADWKHWFSEWCVGHQMPTLWGRRDEFDEIP